MRTYKEALDEAYEHAGSAVGDCIREHVDDLYRQIAKAVWDGSTFHDGFKCGSETEKGRSAELSKEAHRLREQRAELQLQAEELRSRAKELIKENRDLRQSLDKSIEAETAYQKGWDDAVAAAHAPFDVRGIGNDSMDIGTRLRLALKEDARHLGPIGHIGLPGVSKVLRNVAGGRPTSQQEARAAMAEVLTVEEPERFAATTPKDAWGPRDTSVLPEAVHKAWLRAVGEALEGKDWEGLRQLRSIGPLLITSADATS